jgi:hypothetical protein
MSVKSVQICARSSQSGAVNGHAPLDRTQFQVPRRGYTLQRKTSTSEEYIEWTEAHTHVVVSCPLLLGCVDVEACASADVPAGIVAVDRDSTRARVRTYQNELENVTHAAQVFQPTRAIPEA